MNRKPIYLDNAATTPMLPEVIQVMQQSMAENFGNPSSIHSVGRKAKAAIEVARKNIARHFNVEASQIIFTAGGTEANNLILQNAVIHLGVTTIITSKIEHHAVLNTVRFLKKQYPVTVVYVKLDEHGSVNLQHLQEIVATTKGKKLVSLMMVNNEIGNLLPVDKVCQLCKKYDALFHSDTVQAVGHYAIDLQATPIDFIVASAHKFHGPKGVGFLYYKKGLHLQPQLFGGNQEKGVRSGTENTHAIIGMEKALEIAYKNLAQDKQHIIAIKRYAISSLQQKFSAIQFNGAAAIMDASSYTILNVRFPFADAFLLFNLDLQGVVASGGSACQSGSAKTSHVLQALLTEEQLQNTSIRLSFSKYTQQTTIDQLIRAL